MGSSNACIFLVITLGLCIGTRAAALIPLQNNIPYSNTTLPNGAYTDFKYTPTLNTTATVAFTLIGPTSSTPMQFATDGTNIGSTANLNVTWWPCPVVKPPVVDPTVIGVASNSKTSSVSYTLTASEITLDQITFNDSVLASVVPSYGLTVAVFIINVPDTNRSLTISASNRVYIAYNRCPDAGTGDNDFAPVVDSSGLASQTISNSSSVPIKAGPWFVGVVGGYFAPERVYVGACYGDGCKVNFGNVTLGAASSLVPSAVVIAMMSVVSFVTLF